MGFQFFIMVFISIGFLCKSIIFFVVRLSYNDLYRSCIGNRLQLLLFQFADKNCKVVMLWSLSLIWVKLNILSFQKPRLKRSSLRVSIHFSRPQNWPGQSSRGFRSSPGTTSLGTQTPPPWATTGGRTGTSIDSLLLTHQSIILIYSPMNEGTRTSFPTTGGPWESPTEKPGQVRSRTSTLMPPGLFSSISNKTSSQVRWEL